MWCSMQVLCGRVCVCVCGSPGKQEAEEHGGEGDHLESECAGSTLRVALQGLEDSCTEGQPGREAVEERWNENISQNGRIEQSE